MKHPFVVGKRYRNRDGEYEVVALDEPRMVIRYTDGRTIVATIETQAIIWTNMQAESASPPQPARPGPGSGHSRHRSAPKGIRFDGLTEGDFKGGIAGTTWRSRERLGGLLYQGLSAAARRPFLSYPITRRPEVHIARPEHYCRSGHTGHRDAKFVFDLDEHGARFGFYIEKNAGTMDPTWHWPNLLAALRAGEALQEVALAAMRRLDLEYEVYVRSEPPCTVRVAASSDGLAWQREGGHVEIIGCGELVQRLAGLDEGTWSDFYLCARLGKAEAIAAGAGIAEKAVAVYRALLPLCDAAVGGGVS